MNHILLLPHRIDFSLQICSKAAYPFRYLSMGGQICYISLSGGLADGRLLFHLSFAAKNSRLTKMIFLRSTSLLSLKLLSTSFITPFHPRVYDVYDFVPSTWPASLAWVIIITFFYLPSYMVQGDAYCEPVLTMFESLHWSTLF